MEYNISSEYDKKDNAWHIKMQGEIDIYNSTDFKKRLNELLDQHNSDVRIDCENLEYIDSTGLGALVSILKAVKQADNNLYLNNVRHPVMKLFKITDLDKVFIINEVNQYDAG